jgi:hypothetical protein
VKCRTVRADGNLDADRKIGRGAVIVLLQPTADFSRLHADYRVVSGGVIGVAVENFGTDDPLFQLLMLAFEAVVNDVGKEFLTAVAAPKVGACQDFLQLTEDHRLCLAGFRGRMGVRSQRFVVFNRTSHKATRPPLGTIAKPDGVGTPGPVEERSSAGSADV